jgi:ADP-ribose pyrophosphatase YjhB (NUDIX family)
MRKRAGALYIENDKLLLICEGQQGFFWTPGGRLEGDESFEEALERELEEELSARLVSAKLYMTIHDEAADEEVRYFLVDIHLPVDLPANVIYHWYGKDDFQTNTTKISQRIYSKVYPRLVADNLV